MVTWLLHVNAPIAIGLTYVIFFLNNVVSENYSEQHPTPGLGGGGGGGAGGGRKGANAGPMSIKTESTDFVYLINYVSCFQWLPFPFKTCARLT